MTPERMKELRVDMTPGPWKVAPDGRRVFACDERETIICEVSGCAQNAATAAEVQLIAALPECLDEIERLTIQLAELKERCFDVVASYDDDDDLSNGCWPSMERLRNALK